MFHCVDNYTPCPRVLTLFQPSIGYKIHPIAPCVDISPYTRMSIIPITFRSDWSYFMNLRVIGIIKVASKFRCDWCYKIQIRENDRFQKSENLTKDSES